MTNELRNSFHQNASIPDLSTGDEIDSEKAKINYGYVDTVHDVSTIPSAIKLDLDRPVFHQKSFDEAYKLSRPAPKSPLKSTKQYLHSKCECNADVVWNFTKKRIPVLGWLPKYNIKENTVSDLIGGITVGIMQIPQSMAYALLADLPPAVGLYVAFFSVLVYFFLGTSRHLSLGTFAVVCLMTGNIITKYVDKHFPENDTSTVSVTSTIISSSTISSSLTSSFSTLSTSAGTSPPTTANPDADLDLLKIQLGACIAFLVGSMQIGMAIFQLGALSVYLSDTLVSGFTTGAACQVFTSQVKSVLGISIPNHSGVIGIIYTYIDIFSHIKETNLVTLALSASVIVCVMIVNDCINLRFKSKMIMPVPIELLVIIATTLASYYLELHEKYDVQIVGVIPTGIPAPTLPKFSMMGDLVLGSVAVAIVSYCIPISLAKMFGKKHRYDIDPNQELVAYGAGNVIGSLFLCFPSCGSLSRSSLQETSGAKTQVCSLVSCVLILIVLLFIAPLFECVPNCVLAGIIMVALRGMFRQVGDLKKAWKISKSEAAVWVVTFLSVVLLDVDYGLLPAIAFLLIVLLYKLQRPYSTLLGNVPTTDLYLDLQKYKVPKEVKGLKILHFGGALYFANREYLRKQLYKLILNPQEELARLKKKEKMMARNHDANSTISSQDLVDESKRERESIFIPDENSSPMVVFEDRDISETPNTLPPPGSVDTVSAIILDCTAISFIDSAALSMISQLLTEYEEVGIVLCLAGCKDNVIEKLERSDCYKQLERNIFPTIHDAVLNISKLQNAAVTDYPTVHHL